jgi:hypothetical protein
MVWKLRDSVVVERFVSQGFFVLKMYLRVYSNSSLKKGGFCKTVGVCFYRKSVPRMGVLEAFSNGDLRKCVGKGRRL